jgi:hypothetical protein
MAVDLFFVKGDLPMKRKLLTFIYIMAIWPFSQMASAVDALQTLSDPEIGENYVGRLEVFSSLLLPKNKKSGFAAREEINYFLIESATNKRWPLAEGLVGNEELAHFKTGDKVIITGTVFEDDTLIVNAIESDSEITPSSKDPSSTVSAVNARKMIFIIVDFTNSKASDKVSYDSLAQQLFTGKNALNDYFKKASNGLNSIDEDGDGNGKYDIVGPIAINQATTCDTNSYTDAVNKKVSAMGINLAAFQTRVYLLPGSDVLGCGWAGVANLGCGTTCSAWIADNDNFVLAHELGHTFGFAHASDASNEYGDFSCVMGAGWELVNYNAPHMDQNHWFPQTGMIQNVSQSGEYKIKAYTSRYNESKVPGIIKIAKPDTKENYYLSYRQPLGLDSGTLDDTYLAGVSAHTFSNQLNGLSFLRTVLKPGEEVVDSDNKIVIKTLEVDPVAEEATVHIDFAETPEPCANPPLSQLVLSASNMLVKTRAQYQLTLTNLNPASCQNQFALAALFPKGIKATLGPKTNILLAGGKSQTINLNLVKAKNAKKGSFKVQFKINQKVKMTAPLIIR